LQRFTVKLLGSKQLAHGMESTLVSFSSNLAEVTDTYRPQGWPSPTSILELVSSLPKEIIMSSF